ncbi:hypothetical protein JTE90_027201 [Oedothorax gibbosus]|uniref:Protein kinase domain-containing protein n=1 Tax=Oedothorax gibbosus TaxID=931172 RepID=A0AAV6U5R9_9ARAC|nr:hypothetical protein JTE90_027201 [Oedothorax gibbosus]
MAQIPGLLHTPIEDIPHASAEGRDIEMVSFGLKKYTVPDSHRYGKCRLISEFERISLIGEGAYGTIYKVKELKTGDIYALKKLRIETKNECLSKNFIREINILKSLHHDNIINQHGIAVGRNFESTYIILEYCPYELTKVLEDSEACSLLDQSQIKNIMQQLFTGLDYMHRHFILHRDLTPTNILFSSTAILKISDFGESRSFKADETEEKTPNKVTRWYRSPELLFGTKRYSCSIDTWSAACIFGELLLKKPLFPGDSDNDMIALIVQMLGTPNESIWPGMSSLPVMQNYELCAQPYNRLRSHFEGQPNTCIALLHKLFLYNPKTRFTAAECLAHSYFTEDQPTACDLTTLLITLKRADEI